MKLKTILIVAVLAVALLGCGKREPRHIVILPDVSGSIERESLEQAFKAVDDLAGHLQRGDRLTIIPILGDAEAEASGKILRFEVPPNRQAYDTDLRNFRIKLSSSLREMETSAITYPGSKTDILGTIALAEQEFDLDTDRSNKLLVVLSDFIEEDQQFNFKTDYHLKAAASVQSFAMQQIELRHVRLDHVAVYLGLLKSREFAALEKSRRNALKDFWIQYFNNVGAQARFSVDGPALLQLNFL